MSVVEDMDSVKPDIDIQLHRGRGALSNPDNRFETRQSRAIDDGWGEDHREAPKRALVFEKSRSIITRNSSPDVPFSQSINPYRGCEHGCIYCFARPSHAYLGYSPGLDFETRLHVKLDAPARLRDELARPGYRVAPIALGVNTDAYQPLEREQGITRQLLEILLEARHPVSIITKSALIERDIDLLQQLAAHDLVEVLISQTTLDRKLARAMEPRAAAPQRRLQTLARLREAGIPAGVLMAPLIPYLNDHEIEPLLYEARQRDAVHAGYVLLRLPHEVGELFEQWLEQHYPERKQRVLERLRDCRGGELYDSRFGQRMRGTGVFADLIAQRFRKARRARRFPGLPALRHDLFRAPAVNGQQSLF